MNITRRKQLLAAALLVAFDDGLGSTGLDPLPLAERELDARWRKLRSRKVKSYWLGEAARVLVALEIGGSS